MIIVRTPLRISFVGGGSDIRDFYDRCDGQVVCTAIDKFVYAIVKERFDDLIYINYSRKETVESVDEIRHDLVREAMRITGVDKGVEITTLADIPSSGSGLGSSSSITVALLHALYTFRNTLVTAEQLAEDACRIEIDILKKPIGRQDQYAAAFGGVNKLTFKKGGETLRETVSLSPAMTRKFSSSLLLYFTGITRSADVILKQQKDSYQETDTFGMMCRMAGFYLKRLWVRCRLFSTADQSVNNSCPLCTNRGISVSYRDPWLRYFSSSASHSVERSPNTVFLSGITTKSPIRLAINRKRAAASSRVKTSSTPFNPSNMSRIAGKSSFCLR